MAIAATNLTSGNDTLWQPSGSPRYTASITPTADALVLLSIFDNAGPTSVTGCGLTWVEVIDGTNNYGSVWRAMGSSPTTGTIKMDGMHSFGSAWSVDEFTGVDTSGTDGSGAIVQADDAYGLSSYATVTLAAFTSDENRPYAYFAHGHSDTGLSPASGLTELATQQLLTPDFRITTAWVSDAATLTLRADCDDTVAAGALAVGIELAAASDSGHVPTLMMMGV